MLVIKGLKLVTSNELKLREFGRYGLEDIQIEKGRDIEEVESDAKTVILYKALDAGTGRMVEDTSLEVEGADVGVNVRWMIDNLQDLAGRRATWKVFLGLNDGVQIHLYESSIKGVIVEAKGELGFGFDGIFKPDGSDVTLYELEMYGQKDLYSARKDAVQKVIEGDSILSVNVADLPKWDGKYQHT